MQVDWGHLFNPESFDKNDTPENTKCAWALAFGLFGFVDTMVLLWITAKRTIFRSIETICGVQNTSQSALYHSRFVRLVEVMK